MLFGLVFRQQRVQRFHQRPDAMHHVQALRSLQMRQPCVQRDGVRAAQPELAHVADVEQASLCATMQVLFHDAHRVLHGHFISGERHHLGAKFGVQIKQNRAL